VNPCNTHSHALCITQDRFCGAPGIFQSLFSSGPVECVHTLFSGLPGHVAGAGLGKAFPSLSGRGAPEAMYFSSPREKASSGNFTTRGVRFVDAPRHRSRLRIAFRTRPVAALARVPLGDGDLALPEIAASRLMVLSAGVRDIDRRSCIPRLTAGLPGHGPEAQDDSNKDPNDTQADEHAAAAITVLMCVWADNRGLGSGGRK
jgi:hypothetical protein